MPGEMFITHDPDYRPAVRDGEVVSECYDCGWREGSDEARAQHPSERA